jgi:hypothetical protein
MRVACPPEIAVRFGYTNLDHFPKLAAAKAAMPSISWTFISSLGS